MTKLAKYGIDAQTVRIGMAVLLVAAISYVGPTWAFDAAASTIASQTCRAFNAARTVLITAAVLSLVVGLAPMLWGQVKVKWIISCLVVCVLFGLVPTIVGAFAVGGAGCS
jgi:hypothetical protein